MSKISCCVYVATKMTGQDKAELVKRANRVCEILREYGLTPISPVIEEKVKDEPTKLINNNKERLKGFWIRDKEILVKEAHVMLWDHAELKTFGGEREYCLTRGVLWKPTVIYVAPGTPLSVAAFEDDAVFESIHDAAKFIQQQWGTRRKRWKWRLGMLNRTLPKWIWRQILAWK